MSLFKKFKKATTTPTAAAALGFLALFIGTIGGVYSNQLKVSFPLSILEKISPTILNHDIEISIWSFNLHSGFFYTALFLFFMIFVLREREVANIIKRKDLELQDTLRTMPPEGVLEKHDENYRLVRAYLDRFVYTNRWSNDPPTFPDTKTINMAIRLCLDSLCTTAKKFEKFHINSRYAANIMLYYENDGQLKTGNIKNLSLGALTPSTMPNYPGFLDMDKELTSCTNDKDSFSKDNEVRRLIIPVPADSRSGEIQKFHRGAQEAFLGDYGYDYIEDTHMLDCKDDNVLENNFELSRQKYFTDTDDGKLIRSFISIAINHPDYQNGKWEDSRVGVINIHHNHSNLFATKKHEYDYFSLIQHIVSEISYLILLRESS